MEPKTMRMTFASSLSDICSKNASFDSGVLKICYPGKNRNGSYFQKEDLMRCIPSMYNCPVVCNYDRDTDSLGGHDIEIVREDGKVKMVNRTVPVGVIPESARTWFAECEEEDGSRHEYLFAEALIWKRQEAYDKLKRDGIVSQSMEISVKDGDVEDGVYHIRDFEFTAFTLIGVEPCFEGASLTMESFSKEEKESFKRELSEMMSDLKDVYSLVNTPCENAGDDNIPTQKNTAKGGDEVLEEKMKLLEEFGVKQEDLDFSIADISMDELREKLQKFEADDAPDAAGEEPEATDNDPEAADENAEPANNEEEGGEKEEGENEPAPEDDGDDDTADPNAGTNTARIYYELNGNMREWLYDAVTALGTITDRWGDVVPVYWMMDYDLDIGMIYCESYEDWKIYGFKFTMDGDRPVIDVGSKTRMKRAYVQFEGDAQEAAPAIYTMIADKLDKKVNEYRAASETIASMETELAELKSFKTEKVKEELTAKFADISASDAFASIMNSASEYTYEELEDKCYALRGRNVSTAKFNYEPATPRLVVDNTTQDESEPYGGLVKRLRTNAR